MIEKITLNKLQKNLDFFHKMYDVVRLIDPIHKRVVEYRSNGMEQTSEICYSYWRDGWICENCVSMRAYREQKSFIKLEHSPKAVILVTALPIDSAQEPVVLELFKNATDTMMIGSGEYNKGEVLFNAVQDMSDMIIRDELTSLYNRRFIDERLPADIVTAVTKQKPLSLIFIDIDNMKITNDTWGHPAGDKLLKCASNIIKGSIRSETDWVARYGGDEFVVCLNNASNEAALRVSKQIKNKFSKVVLSIEDIEITVKASLGVITMPESGLTAEELIKLADKSMYVSKKLQKIKD
jgi:two-component system cell cycle response regulator